MRKVGLTGNIGSGKSLVAQIFLTLGVPVFDADNEAKAILFSQEVSGKVIRLFGNKILTDGRIDKQKLAGVVFPDKKLLEQLNEIIHPAVREKFESWSILHINRPYLIYEAAILFESGHYKNLDAMINVFAYPEIRIKRVMARDKISRELVLERMQNQWKDDKKNALADFIITNNGNELLIPQVEKIHSILQVVLESRDGEKGI
jgi:dephospho-CoA kinase